MRQKRGRVALLRDDDSIGGYKKPDPIEPKSGRRYLCRNENEPFDVGALGAEECPYCASRNIVEITAEKRKPRKEEKDGG